MSDNCQSTEAGNDGASASLRKPWSAPRVISSDATDTRKVTSPGDYTKSGSTFGGS